MSKYWFEERTGKHGIHPIGLQGWIALVFYIGLLYLACIVDIDNIYFNKIAGKDSLRLIIDVFLITGVFFSVFKHRIRKAEGN